MKLATAAEMREIDRRAIEEYGLTGEVLMENAGSAAAGAAERLWRAAGASGEIVVLCGPGNNGGDGLVVARRLHDQGLPVRALLLAREEKLKGGAQGDAALNYRRARSLGVPLVEAPSGAALRRAVREAGLVVDALLGTGLAGPVRGEIGQAIAATGGAPLVLAVDIPSGINSETGAVLGAAVRADVTVTFGLAKVGMYCYPGRGYCGEIEVADISLPRALLVGPELATELITAERAAAALPRRWPEMHKGDAGRVLIIAGSRGMTGAATAAARAGAGLVYLAIPELLTAILEAKCTEPITLPQPATAGGSLALEAAEGLLERAAECEAVVLGPGLGREPETAELARRLVAALRGPLVVDADALNALAGQADLLARRRGPTVITPHPGELARLRGEAVETLQADRVAAARRTAAELGCVTIFKGAGTVCADPGGLALLNATGNHGLASGGTGDVLAGVLGAFLAGGSSAALHGSPPLEAAVAAVYYHGRAADLYAEERAARSLAASDLLEYLPLALDQGRIA
jgi:NAD(P)H-hydrate epimerase